MSLFTALLLIVKANSAPFSCQFLLLFCFAVAVKGLVCKLAVEHQIRYTKRVVPTDVAVQVVPLLLGDVVSVVTQRRCGHPFLNKLLKNRFKTRPVRPRRPLLVISML